jgi:hypothetical protein
VIRGYVGKSIESGTPMIVARKSAPPILPPRFEIQTRRRKLVAWARVD